ncbi:hypothetical protein BSPWISOXPB_1377 [uncultured Gammaproteobacteria bacterium]|nr:hypothetical protein BSPWISOXPB_1377 [uncultured Gammaproteobacteria bacterium]
MNNHTNFFKVLILSCLFLASTVFAAWPHEDISQAVFAKSVKDRAPIEIITEADNSLGKIYFFTNIRHLKGDKITHRWSYKGKVKAEIDFDIKGNRGVYGQVKTCGIDGRGSGRLRLLIKITKFY